MLTGTHLLSVRSRDTGGCHVSFHDVIIMSSYVFGFHRLLWGFTFRTSRYHLMLLLLPCRVEVCSIFAHRGKTRLGSLIVSAIISDKLTQW